jgi:colicin import membrane protein
MSDSEKHKGWSRWFRWLWQTEKDPDKAGYYRRESEYHESQSQVESARERNEAYWTQRHQQEDRRAEEDRLWQEEQRRREEDQRREEDYRRQQEALRRQEEDRRRYERW